ncbi:MAG: ABC transporter substrate-binding protein [Clostridia bacterium]|nr:ABC transporter substrate-binding protein [Clostridia bacterium]
MKKFLCILLSICMVMCMMTGCGGTTEAPAADTSNVNADQAKAAESTVISGTVDTIDNSTVEARDVLRIGEYQEEWEGTDVIQCDSFYDLQMIIAEPLFLYNHDTGELEGCLAEAPTFAEDGTVMTFVIPEGRTFPNGAELGADDVVASLQHGINDGVMNDTFAIIKELSYEGNTVTLKLENYSTALLILLVSPFFCVIDTEQLETLTTEELRWNAVPFGAYYVSNYVEGGGVTLTRNDGFKTLNSNLENKDAAYIPTIEVTWYEDEFAMIAAYEAGELDFLIGVTEDSVATLNGKDNTVISSSLPPMVRNVQLNPNHEFFADKNVRTAFSYLIDRSVIVESFGGDLMCTPQYEYITENVMYHTPEVEDWYKATYSDDVEKGLAMLEEAGWTDSDGDGILDKDGKPMPTLVFNTASGKNETAALAIQMTLQSYGIAVDVVTTTETTELAKAGEYDMTMCNYWWSEPGRYLVNMFKDHNAFDETEYRALVKEVETDLDNEGRFGKVEAAQKMLMEEMVVIPLYTTSYVKIYDSSLANVHFIVDGMFVNDIK